MPIGFFPFVCWSTSLKESDGHQYGKYSSLFHDLSILMLGSNISDTCELIFKVTRVFFWARIERCFSCSLGSLGTTSLVDTVPLAQDSRSNARAER